MKVQKNRATKLYNNDELINTLLRAAECATRKQKFMLTNGWRLIVKIQSPDGDLHLHIHSDVGGGAFAVAKMQVLEDYSNRYYSGGDDIDYIRNVINLSGLGGESMAQEIKTLTNASQLMPMHHLWLRESVSYTNYYGAIRIPFSLTSPTPNTMELQDSDDGDIKIAFSGASEEQDLFFATVILVALQETMSRLYQKLFCYNLEKLRENQKINFWLTLLDVHEVIPPI